jgi:hypothetical protein
MMKISLKQLTLFAVFAVTFWCGGLAQAAHVDGLYTADAELANSSSSARAKAFSAALAEVLVKVTGQENLPAEKAALFTNAGAFIQQYRMLDGGRISVTFDQRVLRRQLDAAELPVWSAERPAVVVWLAVDEGQGRRSLLGAAGGLSGSSVAVADSYRQALYESADKRGLPLILPLMDGEDLAQASFADVWGGFGDVMLAASARYSANVVLIGRLRLSGAKVQKVRWSMFVAGSESSEWVGELGDGPRVVADMLGQQLATFAAAADAITVTVRGINTLDDYARVLNYLRGLSIVERVGVSRVLAGAVEFSIAARSDSERLNRDISRGGVLDEWVGESADVTPVDSAATLASYRVADGLVYTIK